MSWQIRATAWFFALAIAVVFGLTVHAITNWASAEALGDVVVSFDGSVQVFDNANIGMVETINPPELTGTNGGLAFDASLNLLVANTAGDQLVKLAPDTHSVAGTIATQDAPRALAIAANGTIYVASAGSPTGTIRRIDAAGTADFSVPTDSATCIGIDLAPDQKTMYLATGGRTVKIVDNVDTLANGASASATLFTTLSGTGTACGLRLLAPVDARVAPPAPPALTPLVGGVLVADAKDIKLVRSSSVVSFDTGTGSKNWIDVAVDPDAGASPSVLDFWGVNAGSSPRLVKFRIGGPNPQLTIGLTGVPRGLAINGELRVAQTVQPVQLTNNIEATATFLQGTSYQHSWKGKTTSETPPLSISLAVQAIEVTHINDEQPCSPLNVDCRLQTNFSAATPKTYSRGRGVVYREIRRDAVAPDEILRIGIYFPGPTDQSAGTVCTVNGTPRAGTTILRDPWEHFVFTEDLMEAFYGGDDGGIIRTKTNDSIVVDRSDAKHFLRILKPAQNTQPQLGRSLPVALVVNDPKNNCNFVSGLNEALVLTVTDITPLSADKGKIIGDSKNLLGVLDANGLTWATTANQYRTNFVLDSRFIAAHKYRMCIMAPSFYNEFDNPPLPLAGESCVDFTPKN